MSILKKETFIAESGYEFTKEGGIYIDEQGRTKDDYDNLDIPFEELRYPINENETEKYLNRLKTSPFMERIKRLIPPIEGDDK